MRLYSILWGLLVTNSLASARSCILPTSTGLSASRTITPTATPTDTSLISSSSTSPAINSTATADTTAADTAPPSTSTSTLSSFYLTGHGSGNSNVDGQNVMSGNDGNSVGFNMDDSGFQVTQFSIEDSTSRLMTNGLYVAWDSRYFRLYALSPRLLRSPPLSYVTCDAAVEAGALACVPQGLAPPATFYVQGTSSTNILIQLVLSGQSAADGFVPMDLLAS